jgi:uncharacterized protein (DUF488 family)
LNRAVAPRPELLTIGYEGATLADVLSALRAAKTQILIDVRAVASSRKPGFSKRLLDASLREAGIGYLHLQALGTPKEGRMAVRAGHPERMHPIFHAHMQADRPRAELAQAIAVTREQRACLLCFERDHRTCHRALLAEMIQAETGQAVTHLQAAP